MNKDDKTIGKKSILQMDVKDMFNLDFLQKEINPKILIIILISIMCILSYSYFVLYPYFIEYINTKNKLENAKTELIKYQDELTQVSALNKKLKSLTKESNVKGKRLSHDMEDGLFLIGLDDFMSDLGIKLNNYVIEDIVDYEKFYAIPMSLSVEGDYKRVRELINYLEEQKNVTQVMDYSMETKMTEIKKQTVKKVYWTKDDKNYHLDKSCKDIVQGDILKGTPSQSGSRHPDPNCVGDVKNTIDIEVTTKAKGEVSANIKIIVYSSKQDNIKLDTDKPYKWKPGKDNPFKDTLS